MEHDLLPSNAAPFERAFSLATDEAARLETGIASIRTAKRVSIPESFLPFLIFEYGLGEVSAYVPDLRELLVSGVDWQRVRGTPEAISFALSWLGYAAALEEASPNRTRWNLFQLGLTMIPAADADLENIEAVAGLSVPARSRFWRGYRGHDVREKEWSRHRWGQAAWSASSGVRLRPDGAKWSFGRAHDFPVVLGQTELEPLGLWSPPGSAGLGWGAFTWDGVGASWVDADEQDRINGIVAGLIERDAHLVLKDADGAVIGYRRRRAIHPVLPNYAGQYQVGAIRLGLDAVAPSGLYLEFLTDFGNGAGGVAKSLSLVWGAAPSAGQPPGLLWGGPGAISGGTEILEIPVEIDLNRVTRERVRFHFTF